MCSDAYHTVSPELSGRISSDREPMYRNGGVQLLVDDEIAHFPYRRCDDEVERAQQPENPDKRKCQHRTAVVNIPSIIMQQKAV